MSRARLFPHLTAPEVDLVPATLDHLAALETDRDRLVTLLGSRAPDGWPEFPEGIPFARDWLTQHPDRARWGMQFFLDRASGDLVGSGGFVGSPRDRGVEIGYEIAPEFRGHGYGIAAAATMVVHAVGSGEVDAVIAHTLATENPSARLLARLGFIREAEFEHESDGVVWRWRWTAPAGGAPAE